MISSCSSSTGWTFLCYAAMSVLDCALSLGSFLYWLGYVRVAFGALNVESQCSWAAVTVLDRVLTMSSWSLVEAKMHAKVSIGLALFFGRSLLRLGYVRVALGALYVESQSSWSAGTFLGQDTDHVILVVGCGNDARLCQYWIVRYLRGEF